MAVIREALGAASYEKHLGDNTMRFAVERGVEIISEASRHIPAELKDREPQIDWKSVAGIGNILRHDYANIADDVIYKTATARLDDLEPAVLRLLAYVEGR